VSEDLRDDLVSLTCALMRVPSDEGHPEGWGECLRIARQRLEGLPGLARTEVEEGGHPSLLVLPEGVDRPEVLLLAHLDVVGHELDLFPEPRLEDGCIVGPGAGDMKGIAAVCLRVFEDLHRRHPGISLGLALTTDEETGGHHGAGALVEKHGLRAGVVLVPDGGGPNQLSVAEKGILHLVLEASGRECHAASPWNGVNALEILIRDCLAIQARIAALNNGQDDWVPTCSLTGLRTHNASINVIPDHAEALLDIRLTPSHGAAEMLETLRAGLGPGIRVRSHFLAEACELNPDPLYEACMRDQTGVVERVWNHGASDARYFCRHGIPANMSRPKVGGIHTVDEWIDIASMLDFHAILENYLEGSAR